MTGLWFTRITRSPYGKLVDVIGLPDEPEPVDPPWETAAVLTLYFAVLGVACLCGVIGWLQHPDMRSLAG